MGVHAQQRGTERCSAPTSHVNTRRRDVAAVKRHFLALVPTGGFIPCLETRFLQCNVTGTTCYQQRCW